MSSCTGLLPQSSPSHLIHKEMTGISIHNKRCFRAARALHHPLPLLPHSTALHWTELEGPPGSRLARRAASVVTASPARPPARPSLARSLTHSLARPPRRRGFHSEGWAESLARARAFATFLHFLFYRPPKRREEGKGEKKMSTRMKELRR